MARGHAARVGSGGGDGIPAPRRAGARVAAAATGAGLALVPVAGGGRWHALVVGLAAAAGALLAAALGARLASLLPWALAALGSEYAAWLAFRGGPVDGRAPLYAAGFFLLAELAYRGVEPGAAKPDRRLALRQALAVAALTGAALGLGALVLAAASIPVGGGVALEAAGVAAATAVLALLARLARREGSP